MDLLYYDDYYKIIACLKCQYAITTTSPAIHLLSHHKDDVPARERRQCNEHYKTRLISHPAILSKLRIPRNSPLISYLSLYTNGIACQLCPIQQPFITRSRKNIATHLRQVHQCRLKAKEAGFLKVTHLLWTS